MRLGERSRLHEAGNAAAARGVRLDHIDRVGSHHSSQICGVPTVLASRDVHARWCPAAKQFQTSKVIRGNGFFKPSYSLFGVCQFRKIQGLFARVSTVGIDKELDVAPNRFAGNSHAMWVLGWIATD